MRTPRSPLFLALTIVMGACLNRPPASAQSVSVDAGQAESSGAQPASEQPPHLGENPLEEAPAPWRITLRPGVWAPSLAGDLQLPGGTAIAAVERFNIDDIQPTGFGRWELQRGKLSIFGSGFFFSVDQRNKPDIDRNLGGIDFSADSRAREEFDLISAQVAVGWRVWERTIKARKSEGAVRIAIDVHGGLRVYNLDTRFSQIGGAGTSSDEIWAEPIIGGRITVDILEKATFQLALDGGGQPIGNHSSSSFDIIASINFRPWHNVGLELGWRQLSVDLEDGSGSGKTEFDGELAGIFGSLVIRF